MRNLLPATLVIGATVGFCSCAGSGGGGHGSAAATGASSGGATQGGAAGGSTGGAPGGGTTAGRSGDAVMLADFESGQVPPELNFFVNNQYNAGQYSWSVDPTQGANGTHSSLKLHVDSGAPYFYFDPFHIGHTGYLAQGKNVNRLGFYLKLPSGWGQGNNPFFNLHVGWYLSNDPGQNETNNGHFYHYIYVVPGTDWMHVVVGPNYAWERNQSSSTFDPGWSFHLLDFDSFFGRMTRFYITGAPNPGNFAFAPTPYDLWVDEIELFHEQDLLTASPALVRAAAGSTQSVTLTNFDRNPAVYFVKVTDLDGSGVSVTDEGGNAISRVAIGGGQERHLSVRPNGSGSSNVVFYPENAQQLENAQVQNRSDNTKYRGSYDEPGAAVLVVGQ